MKPAFAYRRFYDAIAPFYGPAMRMLPMWRRYIEAVLPWLPDEGPVLEIGPGPGVLLTTLSRRFPLAVGCDLSPGMIRQARRRLCRHDLPVRLIRADAVALPFRSESFGCLVTTFTFSAIPDGTAAMAEMARVLGSGGTLALVDACLPSDGNRVGTALARLWERFGDLMRDEARLMREAGLTVQECREFGTFTGIRITVGRKDPRATGRESETG